MMALLRFIRWFTFSHVRINKMCSFDVVAALAVAWWHFHVAGQNCEQIL